jgi:CRP-like cAMP-binding protein
VIVGGWWAASRAGDLVHYLTDDEHRRLLGATEDVTVAAGDLVVRRGEEPGSLFIVDSGNVEVVEDSMGETLVLATIRPGGVVGEVGFVDGRPRTHDVRAAGEARLRRLTRAALLKLVENDPALFAKLVIALAELLAARFRSALDELEPIRAFAATLREPLAHGEAGAPDAPVAFDEIDEPLPAGLFEGPEDAVGLIKAVAKKSRRKRASV